jgi:hypothetical protein
LVLVGGLLLVVLHGVSDIDIYGLLARSSRRTPRSTTKASLYTCIW